MRLKYKNDADALSVWTDNASSRIKTGNDVNILGTSRQRTMRAFRVLVRASRGSKGRCLGTSETERNVYRNNSISRPSSFQSVLHTLESLFALFVLFHVRYHKL